MSAGATNEQTMMKRLAFLAFALLPLPASAQIEPLARPFTPPMAGAGITVGGRGVARIAVKTVQFVAFVRGNPDEAGALAAMRAAGIEDAAVGPIGAQVSNGNQTLLRGIVRDVSRAKLDRINEAAAAYVRAHPGASVDNVNFSARVDDCSGPEQTARTAAFAEVRRKAQAIAALAGVALDGIAAVNETGGCPVSQDNPFVNAGLPLELATLTATVSVSETVTFAVSPAGGARRRPL